MSREKRWTEGEWKLHLHDIYVEGPDGDRVIAGVGVSFGARSSEYKLIRPHRHSPEATANAHVMKSAPRLVEALEEAEVLVSTLTDPKAVTPARADVALALLPGIQSALAAAYGETDEGGD